MTFHLYYLSVKKKKKLVEKIVVTGSNKDVLINTEMVRITLLLLFIRK